MSKFHVYSKDGCGFCDRLVDFMDKNNIKYQKYNLNREFSAEEFVNKFGPNSTFPQVIVEDTNIGGMKDTVKYLVENKYV